MNPNHSLSRFSIALALAGALCVFVLVGNAQDRSALSDEESHQLMVDQLREIEISARQSHPFIGLSNANQLALKLEQIEKLADPFREWILLRQISQAKLQLGQEQEAIDHLLRAVELLPSLQQRIGVRGVTETNYELGVAYMRLGETQNCCKRHTPDSCILPIQGEGIHSNRTGSTRAIECFRKVLELSKESGPVTRESRWLLNLAYMTLGDYPNSVPSEYLISYPLDSENSVPKFKNIAAQVGLKTFDMCGGAIVDDFNGDNFFDIACCSWDTSENVLMFLNDKRGGFVDATSGSGLDGITGGLNMIQADYDNDGDVDILVLRGAWLDAAGRHPNSLLQNNGDGTFTDVTLKLGLAIDNHPTQTAAWADYDLDGDLDLYVGNEYTKRCKSSCQLFRNDGDLGFVDVAKTAGVGNRRYTKAVVWGDYNSDRYPDIYVSNMMGPNRLYRNNGDGTFSDVAEMLGVSSPVNSFPAWFFDYNNDGYLDLFASSYDGRTSEIAAHYMKTTTGAETACLYRNNGNGGFDEVAKASGLGQPMLPMGSNFGDLNGDGFLDFYLGTGDPSFSSLVPNMMYLNRSGQSFKDVSISSGMAHLQKGHAVAFADFDNDGDQDVFEQLGGAFPGDKYPNVLFENPGSGNHWLGVRLVGTDSNRQGVGARIKVTVKRKESDNTRAIYRHVSSGGSFGANPLRQFIGLGDAANIVSCEVYWPTTDKTQIFTDVAMDQTIQVVENRNDIEVLKIEKIRFRTGE